MNAKDIINKVQTLSYEIGQQLVGRIACLPSIEEIEKELGGSNE